MGLYERHSEIEYEGFQIADVSDENGNLIWFGKEMEGRWLTSSEIRELAALMLKVANAHDARLNESSATSMRLFNLSGVVNLSLALTGASA